MNDPELQALRGRTARRFMLFGSQRRGRAAERLARLGTPAAATAGEREEIFAVHLRKRRRLPGDYDVTELARRAEGYVGAELEQAIVDAMYVGFNEGREFTTADIAAALDRQVPLSVSQRETISALRDWLRQGRAQSASFAETCEAESQFVQLEPLEL